MLSKKEQSPEELRKIICWLIDKNMQLESELEEVKSGRDLWWRSWEELNKEVEALKEKYSEGVVSCINA